MAIFNKGILGGFSGTIGNIVGGSWRGIDYMRSKPNKVNNPNTPAQQTQRSKFKLVMSLLKKIKPVIQAGFTSDHKRKSAFNIASSYNLKNAVTGSLPDMAIDFSALSVSRGPLVPAEGATAESDSPMTVSFSWSDNSDIGSAQSDDQALILLYNTSKERALYIVEGGAVRSDGSYTMNMPSSYGDDTVEAYLGFVSADGKEASDSEYLGSITVQSEAP
jgi:hypothetical protein